MAWRCRLDSWRGTLTDLLATPSAARPTDVWKNKQASLSQGHLLSYVLDSQMRSRRTGTSGLFFSLGWPKQAAAVFTAQDYYRHSLAVWAFPSVLPTIEIIPVPPVKWLLALLELHSKTASESSRELPPERPISPSNNVTGCHDSIGRQSTNETRLFSCNGPDNKVFRNSGFLARLHNRGSVIITEKL